MINEPNLGPWSCPNNTWYISLKKSLKLLKLCFFPISYICVWISSDVTLLFDKFDITYWGVGGTLIGCIRGEQIIPWDDDVDIGIMHKQKKIIASKNIQHLCKKLNIQIDLKVENLREIYSSKIERYFYSVQGRPTGNSNPYYVDYWINDWIIDWILEPAP